MAAANIQMNRSPGSLACCQEALIGSPAGLRQVGVNAGSARLTCCGAKSRGCRLSSLGPSQASICSSEDSGPVCAVWLSR